MAKIATRFTNAFEPWGLGVSAPCQVRFSHQENKPVISSHPSLLHCSGASWQDWLGGSLQFILSGTCGGLTPSRFGTYVVLWLGVYFVNHKERLSTFKSILVRDNTVLCQEICWKTFHQEPVSDIDKYFRNWKYKQKQSDPEGPSQARTATRRRSRRGDCKQEASGKTA